MFDEYASKVTKKGTENKTGLNPHQVKRDTCHTVVPIHSYAKNNTVQCTRREQKTPDGPWRTCSSFNPDIVLQKDNGEGEGGALTVFLTGQGKINHRVVALEWHDGTKGDSLLGESKYVIHLDTPDLHAPSEGEPNHVLRNQLYSALPGTKPMMCGAQKMDNWDLEKSANKTHNTLYISEAQKSDKISKFDNEIRKGYTYTYSLLGDIYQNCHNCKSWAKQVAPEAII